MILKLPSSSSRLPFLAHAIPFNGISYSLPSAMLKSTCWLFVFLILYWKKSKYFVVVESRGIPATNILLSKVPIPVETPHPQFNVDTMCARVTKSPFGFGHGIIG